MSNGLTFSTLEAANEYVENLREEGLDGKVYSDKNAGTYKVKLIVPQQTMQATEGLPSESKGGVSKVARMFGKGVKSLGENLAHPDDPRRPRIGRLPTHRSEMGISQKINLEAMKDPSLRGKDISGRKH